MCAVLLQLWTDNLRRNSLESACDVSSCATLNTVLRYNAITCYLYHVKGLRWLLCGGLSGAFYPSQFICFSCTETLVWLWVKKKKKEQKNPITLALWSIFLVVSRVTISCALYIILKWGNRWCEIFWQEQNLTITIQNHHTFQHISCNLSLWYNYNYKSWFIFNWE